MYETFCENCSYFILKWFQPNSFEEVCFLKESYENIQKIQILKAPSIQIKEYAFKLFPERGKKPQNLKIFTYDYKHAPEEHLMG